MVFLFFILLCAVLATVVWMLFTTITPMEGDVQKLKIQLTEVQSSQNNLTSQLGSSSDDIMRLAQEFPNLVNQLQETLDELAKDMNAALDELRAAQDGMRADIEEIEVTLEAMQSAALEPIAVKPLKEVRKASDKTKKKRKG